VCDLDEGFDKISEHLKTFVCRCYQHLTKRIEYISEGTNNTSELMETFACGKYYLIPKIIFIRTIINKNNQVRTLKIPFHEGSLMY
jgi:hypothetical protein